MVSDTFLRHSCLTPFSGYPCLTPSLGKRCLTPFSGKKVSDTFWGLLAGVGACGAFFIRIRNSLRRHRLEQDRLGFRELARRVREEHAAGHHQRRPAERILRVDLGPLLDEVA